MENPKKPEDHKKQPKRRKLVLTSDSSDESLPQRQRVEIPEKIDDQLMKCSSNQEEMRSFELGEETQKGEAKLDKILGVCKAKCVELIAELEKKKLECVGIKEKLAELEAMKIAAEEEVKEFRKKQEKRRNEERMAWGKKEQRTRGRVTYLEEELKKMEKDMEHEKKITQGEVEFWRNKFCDLEARILRMENGSVESRISEPRGLHNDAPHKGEMEGDNVLRKRDAEFSGGRHCSRVSELQTKDKVVNEDEVDMKKHGQVEDECPAMSISYESPNVACRSQRAEDVNGRVERASVNESSSENHFGLSAKLPDKVGNVEFVCLDSDDESAGEASKGSSHCSRDSESLGEVMDRMARKYKAKDLKWEFEADMLSSFEEDTELCMKAVCALYRQETFDEKSRTGFFRNFDALRIKNLAEFLMEGDYKGDLKKSVKELELFTSKAVEDCKRLASTYAKQLFSIYKDRQDPLFLPTSTASH